MKLVKTIVTLLITVCSGLFATFAGAAEVEDVNMDIAVHAEGGKIGVSWIASGFHHYNVGWKINGVLQPQIERPGDKNFVVLPGAFRPGACYRVSVQGCNKNPLGKSACTTPEWIICGGQTGGRKNPPCEKGVGHGFSGF